MMKTKTKGQGAPSLALLAVALLAGGCGPRAGAGDAGAGRDCARSGGRRRGGARAGAAARRSRSCAHPGASAGAPTPPSDRADAPSTVKIKLLADSRRQAHVYWGRKDLGVAPLEIVRPRGSGPLDLTVLAPECLPLHTRVFTDRDDTLSLRLYTEREASGLPGYSVVAAQPSWPYAKRGASFEATVECRTCFFRFFPLFSFQLDRVSPIMPAIFPRKGEHTHGQADV